MVLQNGVPLEIRVWDTQRGTLARNPRKDALERCPCHVALLAATAEHPVPVPCHRPIDPEETREIARQSTVGVVPLEERVHAGRLVVQRVMANLAHERLKLLQRAPETPFLGPAADLEPALLIARAVMREAQEVQGVRRRPAVLLRIAGGEAPKRNPAGFGRFEGQSKRTEPAAQYVLKALRVPLVFKAPDKVVNIAHQVRFTFQPGFDVVEVRYC